MKESIKKMILEKKSWEFLFLLLIADLAFIIVHGFYLEHIISDPLYSIEMESGYAEIFMYIKEYWIAILILIIAVRKKTFIYYAWFFLFLYILFDDSFAIHESVGNYLPNYFEFKQILNLRIEDIGELIASAIVGLYLIAVFVASYLYSNSEDKKISKHLFILVLLLSFFGVLIDMFHIAIPWGTSVWGILEDGGEMLIMSIIVWYIFNLKIDLKECER